MTVIEKVQISLLGCRIALKSMKGGALGSGYDNREVSVLACLKSLNAFRVLSSQVHSCLSLVVVTG